MSSLQLALSQPQLLPLLRLLLSPDRASETLVSRIGLGVWCSGHLQAPLRVQASRVVAKLQRSSLSVAVHSSVAVAPRGRRQQLRGSMLVLRSTRASMQKLRSLLRRPPRVVYIVTVKSSTLLLATQPLLREGQFFRDDFQSSHCVKRCQVVLS